MKGFFDSVRVGSGLVTPDAGLFWFFSPSLFPLFPSFSTPLLRLAQGKKKRHTFDVSKESSGDFQAAVDDAGQDAKEKRNSHTEEPRRTDSAGAFSKLTVKLKSGIHGLSGSSSPYISDDEETAPDGPAPQLNFQHYGSMDAQEAPKVSQSAPQLNEAPPAIQVHKPPYVEDDPSLTVIKMCEAIYDYEAQEDSEMSFVKGDEIAVYSYKPDYACYNEYV